MRYPGLFHSHVEVRDRYSGVHQTHGKQQKQAFQVQTCLWVQGFCLTPSIREEEADLKKVPILVVCRKIVLIWVGS